MKATRIVLSWVGALAVVVVALPGFAYTTWASDQEVLSAVQSATVQFHRTDVARSEGYEPFLPCMQEVGVGGMGYHYVNFSIVDLNIEPLAPEAMVYAPGPNGQLQLGAVEYIVPADAWDKAGNSRPPSLFGQTFSRNDMLCTRGCGSTTRPVCTRPGTPQCRATGTSPAESGSSKRTETATTLDRNRAKGEIKMPLYMDVHNLPGATAGDVAEAHIKDLQAQEKHGVRYLRYWVNEGEGKVFCLVAAPDAEAANTVHREAHGLVADEIYEVEEGS